MIPRLLENHLRSIAARFPVAVLTGPRQSGKTTLARLVLPDLPYVSLERPDNRLRATDDPRAFLSSMPDGGIIDEVQRVPDLLSYLQDLVDLHPGTMRWVLTGSHNLMLLSSLAQSLAGRAGLLTLPPFSYAELAAAGKAPSNVWEAVWRGSYPPLYDRDVTPTEWLGSYITTYVERDVRDVLEIRDLASFQTFLSLAAARTGALQNASTLGSDAGIAHATANEWMSVLDASYIAFRVKPFFRNIGKRLTKTPKLHFWDTGLVSQLLGIQSPAELKLHPLRGAIFESWVASEIHKWHLGRATKPDITFFRDQHGLEMDLLVRAGSTTTLVEVKSGQTIGSDAYANFKKVEPLIAKDPLGVTMLKKVLVYAGDETFTHDGVEVIPWSAIGDRDWMR